LGRLSSHLAFECGGAAPSLLSNKICNIYEAQWAAEGKVLPDYVQREFEDYLKCSRVEHGFLRVRCDTCHAEQLVAFSCKRRGFCPSCGARRMAESAALLVDEVFPEQPVRQWVLSFPYPLRFLFASRPAIMGKVLGIVYRVIATHLIKKAGFTTQTGHTGAVTLIQRLGSAFDLLPINSAMRNVRISFNLSNGRTTNETQAIYGRANYWNFEGT